MTRATACRRRRWLGARSRSAAFQRGAALWAMRADIRERKHMAGEQNAQLTRALRATRSGLYASCQHYLVYPSSLYAPKADELRGLSSPMPSHVPCSGPRRGGLTWVFRTQLVA